MANDQIYQVGGSLPYNSNTYVIRDADKIFYETLQNGEFCYVFNARQMGKSSLRVRVMERLQSEGVVCIFIDLNGMGKSDLTIEKWYAGIVRTLVYSCKLNKKIHWQSWWKEKSNYSSSVQILKEFIEEILLIEIQQPIVIFVDEIDRVLSQDFSLDDFFNLIRYFYNSRIQDSKYTRLTFTLLGVSTPSTLIRDKTRNPFNIGRAINLDGFTIDEAAPLMLGFNKKLRDTQAIIREVLNWTKGQPFLTQKICQLINQTVNDEYFYSVEEIVRNKIIKDWEFQDEPQHLRTIRDRLLRNEKRSGRLLELYQCLLQNREGIRADDSVEQWELRLSGLVLVQDGQLKIYNPIYENIFDVNWVDQQLKNLRPYTESFTNWIESSYSDTSRLLRGKALQEAQEWAKGKSLSDLDYQFLSASNELKLEEISQQKLRKKVQEQQILIIIVIIIAVIVVLLALLSFQQQRQTLAQRNRAEVAEIKTLNLLTEALLNADDTKENLESLISSIKSGKHFIEIKDSLDNKTRKEIQNEVENILGHTVYDVLERNRFKHNNPVLSVAFSPNGEIIASGSKDEPAKLWLLNRNKHSELKHENTNSSDGVAFSNDGNLIAIANTENRSIDLYNLNNKLIRTFVSNDSSFNKVIFTPNNQYIAASSKDHKIKLFQVSDGHLVRTLFGDQEDSQNKKQKYDFLDIKFSPNGQFIAAASTDRTIKIWSRSSGELLHILKGHEDWVYAISFSPDGKYIVSGGGGSDKSLRFWEISTEKTIKIIKDADSSVHSIRFSSDGKLIASAGGEQVLKIWDFNSILSSNKFELFNHQDILLKAIKGHKSEINDLDFSPDGNLIALAGNNQVVTLWKLNKVLQKSINASNQKILKLVFSSDGKKFASSGADGVIRIWDNQGKLLEDFKVNEEWIYGLSFSPDGKLIASASEDNTVKIWQIENIENTSLSYELKQDDKAYDVSFSPDGKLIASISKDNKLKLWNTSNKELVHTVESTYDVYWSSSLNFSPDGKFIAANAKDGKIKMWRVENNKLIQMKEFEDKDSNKAIYKIGFSPDGHLIAGASLDNKVRIWDIQTSELIMVLKDHKGEVIDVKFSQNGKLIASSSDDKTVKLWTYDGRLLKTLEGHEDVVTSVVFSPDSKTLISSDGKGIIKLWNLEIVEKDVLDLNQLMKRGCEILHDYLENPQNIGNENQYLCQGI